MVFRPKKSHDERAGKSPLPESLGKEKTGRKKLAVRLERPIDAQNYKKIKILRYLT